MSIGDWIGEHWEKFKNGLLGLPNAQFDYARDLYNIAFSESDQSVKDRVVNGWTRTLDLGQQELGNVGKVISPVMDLPVAKQLGEAISWGQKNLVNRPISSFYLAMAESDPFGSVGLEVPTDLGKFFSPSTWHKAWNDSANVSAGQAAMYASDVGMGLAKAGDPQYDPRTPEGQRRYYEDWFYRTTSGTIDFVIALADPFKGAGKLAKLGKLAVYDKAVTGAKLASGALERQTFGKTAEFGQSLSEAGGQLDRNTEALYQQARVLSASDLNRLYFNQHAHGGVVAAGLKAAAEAGDRELFSDALMSARGSVPANTRLAEDVGGRGQILATEIGKARNPYGVANVIRRMPDDQLAYESGAAIAEETHASALNNIVESSPAGHPEVGTLADLHKAIEGAPMPRVRPNLDALRLGIYKFGTSGYSSLQNVNLFQRVVIKGVKGAARIGPQFGYASHLMLNEISSYRQFRANLERAGDYIAPEVKDSFVNAYMAALDANERGRIAGIADNHIIGNIATRYGLTKDQVQLLVREASLRRGAFRQMLNKQDKFLPTEFQKLANEMIRKGAREEAEKLQQHADRFADLADVVDADGVPLHPEAGRYYSAMDEMGNQIWIRNGDWENPYAIDKKGRMQAVEPVKTSEPLLTSQGADRMPMLDYQAFDRALRRVAQHKTTIDRYESDLARVEAGRNALYPQISRAKYLKAKTLQGASTAASIVEDFYEAFNHVWSVAAVLRPAQILRQLGDDGSRVLTMMGVVGSLVSGSEGLGRIAYNLGRRGMTFAQQHNLDKSFRALTGRSHETVPVEAIEPAAVSLEPLSESAGHYNYITPRSGGATQIGRYEMYDSIEAAVVAGRLPLDTYINYAFGSQRRGQLPHDLDQILSAYNDGLFRDARGGTGKRRLRREVLEYLGNMTGTLSYIAPAWQEDALQAINYMAMDEPRFRKSHGIIMNPMTDDAEMILDRHADRDYDFIENTHLHRNPETSEFDDADGLFDFITEHVDRFLAGGYRLHAKMSTEGTVRLSVVRHNSAPRAVVERLTDRQRKMIENGLKARGTSGVRLVDGKGEILIPGSFAGLDGDFAKTQVSANYAPHAIAKGAKAADRAYAWNAKISYRDADPFTTDQAGKKMPNPEWAPAYEETVNYTVANDDAARRLLSGQSEAQVVEWLESDRPDALRYLNARPTMGLTVPDHVSRVRALVDFMVPPEAGQGIRDKALRHQASADDLRGVVKDSLLPQVVAEHVQASLGIHPTIRWVQRGIQWWFRNIQDKPADFLVRYPFYDHRYKLHFNPMFESYKAQVPGHLISQTEVDRIARMARQRAIDDTKRYLYDNTFRTDFAQFMSPLMPFSNAVADAFFKWAKIAWEKPFDVLSNWNNVFNFPERAGLVYDQDGNSLDYKDGKQRWISKLDGSVMPDKVRDPVTGKMVDAQHDRYVAFQVPSWIKIPGGQKLVSFNKNSMTSAIFDPSVNVGPLVALPVNQFALYKPEVGENDFVKRYVLPFGPTDQQSRMLLPGLLGAARKWFTEDESKASSSAMAIYQTQLTDILKNKRTAPPSLEEAKEQARHEQWLRFATSAFSPVSFQYETPYKPYIDLYSQLLRKYNGDGNAAMEEFRQRVGDEYMYLAARVTKSNIAIPSTMAGYRAFKEKQDAIYKYPELTSLITGAEGAGSFSKSVYEWEKRQTYDPTGKPIREEQNITESIDDVQRRIGWSNFQRHMALLQNDLSRRGLTSINSAGAEDLKQAYQQFIQANAFWKGPDGTVDISPWFKDFRSTDDSAMTSRLAQMRELLMEHPDWLKGRDDLQGLAQYLNQRDRLKAQMHDLGYATLDSQKAQWLQDYWQAQVFGLKQGNLAFGQLYDRWLVKDNLGAEAIAAETILQMLSGVQGANY